MLVQKGYIEKEVGLFSSLQDLFKKSMFSDGKPPTSHFENAFLAVINETGSRLATVQRRALGRTVSRTAADLHGLLNPNTNRFFKTKSLLQIYRDAEWLPDRVPDDEIEMPSVLGCVRLSQTKIVQELETGMTTFKPRLLESRIKYQWCKHEYNRLSIFMRPGELL